jgi:hypothetical protein
MRFHRSRAAGASVVAVGVLIGAGCDGGGASRDTGARGGANGGQPSPAPGPTTATADNVHGHSHERGKMLLADAGTKHHALLTAHLSSKDGNELDIFFETADEKNPQPVALPMESFTAQARREADEEVHELKFECAPPDERPKGEKPGTCSHFVAKAPWMKPGDNLYVVAKVRVDGDDVTVRWKDFNPKKYAHHEE